MTHIEIWCAIDNCAHRHGISCSRLAIISGLNPTTFNKSKRWNKYGKPRWPSTYSLSKILSATGMTLDEFIKLIPEKQK